MGASVLVVDDDPDSLPMWCRALSRGGCEALPACSGPEALAKASASRPGLILLDLTMRDMDGIECYRLLKASPRTKDIPVIVFTGWDYPTTVLELAAAGIGSEPFCKVSGLDRLMERVRKALHPGGGKAKGDSPAGLVVRGATIWRGPVMADLSRRLLWVRGGCEARIPAGPSTSFARS